MACRPRQLQIAPSRNWASTTRLELETAAGVTRSLQLAREAGVRWIRQQFLWTDLERRKGQYTHETTGRTTWDKYDHIVDTAASHDIRIIARLDRPPEWARPPRQ